MPRWLAIILCASQLGLAAPLDLIGRTPDASELAAIDIDVMPDGTGLPDGSGTVALGRQLYTEYCVSCHGEQGMGGSHDVLADPSGQQKTIANHWPYATTLFDYIRRAMPYDRAGLLSDQQVYSLTAYLLHLNNLFSEQSVLDATTLVNIQMPAQSRFVVDDRVGGPEVK